jgi:Zn-dependent protease
MNSGVPLGRIFGIEIRAHWTWVFLLAMITVAFGAGLSAQTDDGLGPALGWATAIVTAVLVFASVTAHELAHVGIARRNGIGGNVVVVQMLGGTYLMEVRPRTPGQELRTALAGPVMSLVLLSIFGAAACFLELVWGASDNVPQQIAAAAFVTEVLALFNMFLAAINLIPGYPMDGARVVHAISWARSGREDVANATASRVGRLVGGGVMVVGAVLVPLTDLWPGLALIVAGWLLIGSSRVLDRRAMLQSLIAGARVSDALDSDPARIPPQLTLDVFAGEYLGDRLGAAALVERGQELMGMIGTAQIRRIPRRNWPLTRTEQVMVPLGSVPRTSGDAELWPALETLERSGLDALLIGTGEQVSALLTRRSVAHLISQLAEEHAKQSSAATAPRGLFGRRRPPAPPSARRSSAARPPAPPSEPTAAPTHESHDTDDTQR